MTTAWQAFPPRQITGRPYRYYGYVGRNRTERHCHDGTHRKYTRAEECAARLARSLNRPERAAEATEAGGS